MASAQPQVQLGSVRYGASVLERLFCQVLDEQDLEYVQLDLSRRQLLEGDLEGLVVGLGQPRAQLESLRWDAKAQ